MFDLPSYWNFPTEIHAGKDALLQLPLFCRQQHYRNIFLVSDKGLSSLGLPQKIISLLNDNDINASLFDAVASNPSATDVGHGVARFKEQPFDAIVALGGGSVLDAAKGIALVATRADGLKHYDWNTACTLYPTLASFPRENLPPLIMLPTTAGTGSELSREAVIIDPDDGIKHVVTHAGLLARLVLLDPVLTAGLPARLTAATGIDALTHHIEALVSPMEHPMSSGIAQEGIRLIHRYLPLAVCEPDNLEARSGMLVASAMAAVAFQKGLGGVHALAHALGARYHQHHGLLNAILLPYVLAANAPAIPDRLALIASILELPGKDIHAVLNWLGNFLRTLEIPATLAAIGINADEADLIGQMAANDLSSADTNPIHFTPIQYAAIFRDAVQGNLTIRT